MFIMPLQHIITCVLHGQNIFESRLKSNKLRSNQLKFIINIHIVNNVNMCLSLGRFHYVFIFIHIVYYHYPAIFY